MSYYAGKAAMSAMTNEASRGANRWHQRAEYIRNFEQNGVENQEESDNRDFLAETKQRMKERAVLAKLEILLLDYTFNEDDGKISMFEGRAIKNHFKSYRKKISQDDIHDIGQVMNTSFNDISSHVINNNIPKTDRNKALYTLRKICKNKERYAKIIRDLETRLIKTDDFM